jgi:hypothetical protein
MGAPTEGRPYEHFDKIQAARLCLAVVMVWAVITHVFIVGGSPQPAIIPLIVTGAVY